MKGYRNSWTWKKIPMLVFVSLKSVFFFPTASRGGRVLTPLWHCVCSLMYVSTTLWLSAKWINIQIKFVTLAHTHVKSWTWKWSIPSCLAFFPLWKLYQTWESRMRQHKLSRSLKQVGEILQYCTPKSSKLVTSTDSSCYYRTAGFHVANVANFDWRGNNTWCSVEKHLGKITGTVYSNSFPNITQSIVCFSLSISGLWESSCWRGWDICEGNYYPVSPSNSFALISHKHQCSWEFQEWMREWLEVGLQMCVCAKLYKEDLKCCVCSKT